MSQQDRPEGPPRGAVPRPRGGTHSNDGASTPSVGIPGIDLGEVIGHGGFATVYLGRQRGLDRPVAVKVDSRPLSDERNRRRFFREATASSRISGHPHVVSLIDAGTTADGRPYLVMEWCPHGSLKSLLRRTGPMRPAEVRDLGLALSSALAAAHEAGILHRDIKPGNVLIDAYGAPRLSDFGLAALPRPGQELSVTLEALTPAFAAPEAFTSADPTPASDVWSMGATLHAMLTTSSPRRSSDGSPASIEHVIAHLSDPLPDPQVPGADELMAVIRTATAYDPAERYPTGRELYDALRAVSTDAAGGAGRLIGGPEAAFTALPAAPPTAPPVSRRRVAAAVVGLVAGLLVGGGAGVAIDRTLLHDDPVAAGSATAEGPGAGAKSAGDDQGPAGGDTPASSSPPELGVCWHGINAIGSAVTAAEASCNEPHYWETFASGVLTTATTPYVEEVAADPAVVETCTRDALRSYAGSARSLEIAVLPPDVIAWEAGDRGFSCVAGLRRGGETEGTLRRD